MFMEVSFPSVSRVMRRLLPRPSTTWSSPVNWPMSATPRLSSSILPLRPTPSLRLRNSLPLVWLPTWFACPLALRISRTSLPISRLRLRSHLKLNENISFWSFMRQLERSWFFRGDGRYVNVIVNITTDFAEVLDSKWIKFGLLRSLNGKLNLKLSSRNHGITTTDWQLGFPLSTWTSWSLELDAKDTWCLGEESNAHHALSPRRNSRLSRELLDPCLEMVRRSDQKVIEYYGPATFTHLCFKFTPQYSHTNSHTLWFGLEE